MALTLMSFHALAGMAKPEPSFEVEIRMPFESAPDGLVGLVPMKNTPPPDARRVRQAGISSW